MNFIRNLLHHVGPHTLNASAHAINWLSFGVMDADHCSKITLQLRERTFSPLSVKSPTSVECDHQHSSPAVNINNCKQANSLLKKHSQENNKIILYVSTFLWIFLNQPFKWNGEGNRKWLVIAGDAWICVFKNELVYRSRISIWNH